MVTTPIKFKKMELNHDERYTKRLEHEYRVITEMGLKTTFNCE